MMTLNDSCRFLDMFGQLVVMSELVFWKVWCSMGGAVCFCVILLVCVYVVSFLSSVVCPLSISKRNRANRYAAQNIDEY